MDNNLNIVLVLQASEEYNVNDVQLLAFHLLKWKGSRNVKIYCLFDRIKNPITLFGVKFLPMQYKWKGWWSKMNLFSPALDELKPFLFFDLDTAIVGPYEDSIPKGELRNKFIALEDFYQKNQIASGMMWIPENYLTLQIWNRWIMNYQMYMQKYRGDQEYIRSVVKDQKNFFQEFSDQNQSFKPNRKWTYVIPQGRTIIHFHGYPKIERAAETVNWVKNYNNKL